MAANTLSLFLSIFELKQKWLFHLFLVLYIFIYSTCLLHTLDLLYTREILTCVITCTIYNECHKLCQIVLNGSTSTVLFLKSL